MFPTFKKKHHQELSPPKKKNEENPSRFFCSFQMRLCPTLGSLPRKAERRNLKPPETRRSVPARAPSKIVISWFSKNRGGPPKWMVKIMENPISKWMIWGAHPYFWFNTHIMVFPTVNQGFLGEVIQYHFLKLSIIRSAGAGYTHSQLTTIRIPYTQQNARTPMHKTIRLVSTQVRMRDF